MMHQPNGSEEAIRMADEAKRVFPYGVKCGPAVYACIDCGLQYRHKKIGNLPPCRHYNETTHGRAGWHRPDDGNGSEGEDRSRTAGSPAN